MIFSIILLILLFITIRESFLFTKEMRLIDSILNYRLECIRKFERHQVDFCDVKEATNAKVLLRIWDWSYTALIDKEKLEIIKPFILNSKPPQCYDKPNTPNGMAENGCDGCEYARMCDVNRKAAVLHENC